MTSKIDTIEEMHNKIIELSSQVISANRFIKELKELNISNKNIIRILRREIDKKCKEK